MPRVATHEPINVVVATPHDGKTAVGGDRPVVNVVGRERRDRGVLPFRVPEHPRADSGNANHTYLVSTRATKSKRTSSAESSANSPADPRKGGFYTSPSVSSNRG